MTKIKNVVLLAALLYYVAAMEVTELKWGGQHSYAVLQGQAAVEKVLTCKYKLDPLDLESEVVFSKDNLALKTFKTPSQIVPRKEYSQEYKFIVSSRKDGGHVTCKVKNKKSGNHSERSTHLHVVQTEATNTDNYHVSLQQENNCVVRYTEETPWSDPPIQSKCGIWQFESNTDKDKGSWVPKSSKAKTLYSSEKSDYKKESYKKSNHALSKAKRFVLDATFKLRDLPKGKFMQLRCHHYYKFGSGNEAVRIDRDIYQDRLMPDFKFRCPALTNQTATNGTGSVVAAFNNPGPTDCMGMWSSSNPIMGKLNCVKTNTSYAVDLTCEDQQWRRLSANKQTSDGRKFYVQSWVDDCVGAGTTVVLNLGLLVLGIVTSTAFYKN